MGGRGAGTGRSAGAGGAAGANTGNSPQPLSGSIKARDIQKGDVINVGGVGERQVEKVVLGFNGQRQYKVKGIKVPVIPSRVTFVYRNGKKYVID